MIQTDFNPLYLEGTPEGEHLRAEFDVDCVKLILQVSTGVEDQPIDRFKPLRPMFKDKYVAVLSYEQVEMMRKRDVPPR